MIEDGGGGFPGIYVEQEKRAELIANHGNPMFPRRAPIGTYFDEAMAAGIRTLSGRRPAESVEAGAGQTGRDGNWGDCPQETGIKQTLSNNRRTDAPQDVKLRDLY